MSRFYRFLGCVVFSALLLSLPAVAQDAAEQIDGKETYGLLLVRLQKALGRDLKRDQANEVRTATRQMLPRLRGNEAEFVLSVGKAVGLSLEQIKPILEKIDTDKPGWEQSFGASITALRTRPISPEEGALVLQAHKVRQAAKKSVEQDFARAVARASGLSMTTVLKLMPEIKI